MFIKSSTGISFSTADGDFFLSFYSSGKYQHIIYIIIFSSRYIYKYIFGKRTYIEFQCYRPESFLVLLQIWWLCAFIWEVGQIRVGSTQECRRMNNTGNCSMILNTLSYWSVKFRTEKVTMSDTKFCIFPLSVIYFKFYLFFFLDLQQKYGFQLFVVQRNPSGHN